MDFIDSYAFLRWAIRFVVVLFLAGDLMTLAVGDFGIVWFGVR